MKVLLLGATGRTGRLVLDYLLESKHIVNIIVRDKSKVKNHSDNLHIIEATIDKETLHHAMSGCKAVISVLNISRTSDFPWAGLRTPENFLSETMVSVIETANRLSIERIIVCSAWGVLETKNDLPAWFRWFIDHTNIGAAYADHEKQEALLVKSAMNFTIVRPVGLTNSTKEKEILISRQNSPKPKLTISRKSVAKFLVWQLESNAFHRDVITISEG